MRTVSLIGIILKGRYCIIERLGQGGGGHLYLARDLELGGLWAVKELPLSGKKEAKLLRLLEYPSLPKMVDYLERGEYCYLVMEYIRGKSLGEWLRCGRCFSRQEILELGLAAARVMKYLHTRKPPVYYGDLKPENLMLTENGRLYLVDLGSAVFGYTDRQKLCTGTKGYAAPEQYEGKMSVSSDIYAFGKTLLELCGRNKAKYFLQCPSLGYLILRCCRTQEQMRFQTMEQVIQRIKKIQKKQHARKIRFTAILGIMGLISVRLLWNPVPAFSEALAGVTQEYYQEAFLRGEREEQKEIAKAAEKKLHRLLKNYTGKKEQRILLLMLAHNSEFLGNEERASFYYKQLLLYDGEFRGAYGEYGLFLERQGAEEDAEQLWKEYRQANTGEEEKEESRSLKLWERKMKMFSERQQESGGETEE